MREGSGIYSLLFIRPLRRKYAWGLYTVFSFLVRPTLPPKSTNQPTPRVKSRTEKDPIVFLWTHHQTMGHDPYIDAPLLVHHPHLRFEIFHLRNSLRTHTGMLLVHRSASSRCTIHGVGKMARLIGHADNIRAILTSDDTKYVSASLGGSDIDRYCQI